MLEGKNLSVLFGELGIKRVCGALMMPTVIVQQKREGARHPITNKRRVNNAIRNLDGGFANKSSLLMFTHFPSQIPQAWDGISINKSLNATKKTTSPRLFLVAA